LNFAPISSVTLTNECRVTPDSIPLVPSLYISTTYLFPATVESWFDSVQRTEDFAQTGSDAHISCFSMRTEGCFLGGKVTGAKFKMRGDLPAPSISCHVVQRDSLTFAFISYP